VAGEPLGCGDILSTGAAPSGQQLCQRQLRAPQGQRVRLEINAVDLAPGAFLLVFDGATPPPRPFATRGPAAVLPRASVEDMVGDQAILV
jgi:hypothetical protein